MTFEEFFKKKRIDLTALKKAEPKLFSEFRVHYEEMGEISFDHSKKYWFNKLRHQFQLAPEVKTEKVHIANPLAEQTITESLIETPDAPAPKPAFVPRFRAVNVPKPASTLEDNEDGATSSNLPEPTVESTTPKPGYRPRFNVKTVPPKQDDQNL